MAGLSVSVLDALRTQYIHEKHNSHKYMTRACWANYHGLLNIEKFFKNQACDENGHADKIYTYITERGEMIDHAMPGVDEILPDNLMGIFSTAFEVELDTTERLKAIYRLAHDEEDYLTAGWMLSGLIAEQVEEEDTFQTIIDRINARLNNTPASDFSGGASMASEPGAALHDIDVWIGETYLG